MANACIKSNGINTFVPMKKILTALAVLICIAGHAQWKGFAAPVMYQLPGTPSSVVIKDIDGDNKIDVFASHTAAGTFSILKGDGTGSFLPAQATVKENNYNLSDFADLNGDGLPDKVTSSYWDNGFKIYFAKLGGGFADGVYYFTAVHGRNVKCVDINKDGKMDIISTSSGSGNTISLHIFIGKGDGTFEAKKSYPSVLDTCKDILITDKNGDGRLDIIVTSSFAWVLFYMQETDGSFTPHYWSTQKTAQVSFGDVNNDALDDMMLSYSSFDNDLGTDSLVIYLNTGGILFSSTSINILANLKEKILPYHVKVADINKDGKQDLIISQVDMLGYLTDTLLYFQGMGNGVFNKPQKIGFPQRVLNFNITDINGDNYPDIIAGCDGNTMVVLLNNKVVTDTIASFKIFPNPVVDKLQIYFPLSNNYLIRILDVSGRVVATKKASKHNETIAVSGLDKGIFCVQILYDDKVINHRFIKM